MIASRIRAMSGTHWIALFAAMLCAWGVLFLMAIPDELRALEGVYGADLIAAICGVTPGAAGLAGGIAMWALMSAAMMLPTALPAFATYDDLGHATETGFGQLVAGYVTVWLVFSVAAGLAQTALFEAGLIGVLGQSQSAVLTAVLLFGAGLYQFSPMKEACLSRCRAPLTFFMAHWEEGPYQNGLRLGADCVGCCWALMALAFVGGTMNMAFMGLALLIMTLEKLPDLGRFVTRPLGWGLMALAPVTLIF